MPMVAPTGRIPARSSLRLATLIAALALLVVACGGDDDTPAADTDPAPPPATAEADGDDAAGDAAEPAGGGGDVAALTSDQCQAALDALQTIPTFLTSALSGQGEDKAAVAAQAEAFANLADQVPAEVAADFQVLADVYGEIGETLAGVDLSPGQVPDPATLGALTELSTSLSSSEITAATTNISTFLTTTCGG